MNQFREFLGFELKLRFKSATTYVYFFLWALFAFLCVASESFSRTARFSGKVLLNSGFANAVNDTSASLFGIIVIAAIFGTSILRDFQHDTTQILFTKPVSRFAYISGRWLGSYLVTLFTFSGLLLGTWLGTFAPWADHSRIGPNHLWLYLQPFLSIVAVQVFFLGALFFTVAALSRKVFVVYVQGAALFVLYLIGITVFDATRSTEHFWSGILDPMGLQLFSVLSRYWTAAEMNTLLLPWDTTSGYAPGVFLYNRLLWIGVGVAVLGLLWVLFPMSVESLTSSAQGKRAARLRKQDEVQARAPRSQIATSLPQVHPRHGAGVAWRQFLSLTRLRTNGILRSVPFLALAGLLVAFSAINGWYAGRSNGVDVWPVTYLMLEVVEGSAFLFFLIIASLYAAELAWREREHRFDGIHDALPLGVLPDWLSKLVAIAVVEAMLLALAMLVGIVMQTVLGYYHYEPWLYLKELYLIAFPQILGFAMLALFVQVVVPNKFLGLTISIGIWVVVPMLYSFGVENTLLLPGTVPFFIYSDMNGYGPYVQPIFWSITYWLAVFTFLSVLSQALARRGAEVGLKSRVRQAWKHVGRWMPAALACLLLAVGAGGWFYYNSHVLNEFLTKKQRQGIRAGYERDFKQYEHIPLPKVTAVDVKVEIYPDKRSFAATGSYVLENKAGVPIKELHFTDANDAVRELRFGRPAQLVSKAPRNLYSIYALDTPLQPGETMQLDFKVGHDTKGFHDGTVSAFGGGDSDGNFAYNGTFFDLAYFPSLGYDSGMELDDPRRRREHGLGAQEEMPPRGDVKGARTNLFTSHSDWISFHAVVGTAGDQLAMAPGYLQKQWQENGRNYYEYSMGNQPILNFFAFVSGRYEVRKDVYQGVNGPINLEFYYHPGHTYALDSMLAAVRDGLAYNEKYFSPFQFRQYRVLEYPRYRGFAQSFPNTVPFSEGMGFIQRRKRPQDADFAYYITAHELGHQWWGHQLIGGQVQGSNMMSETLAEYSALMALKHKYGEYSEPFRVLLRQRELDSYLRGRVSEQRKERPLALVQNEPYVWYNKGGLVMYALADYVGEDKVNLALRNFLTRYRYANAGSGPDGPYPDTRLLVESLLEQTPPELHYLVEDGFNRIVLYDNRAISATSKKRADGKYDVTLTVQAGKVQADGDGNDKPAPLADYIDIGVFEGTGNDLKPLLMQREKFGDGKRTFTLVVDKPPTRAGIDPYNKLIDRIADDNLLDVVAAKN
ncbi:MAG: hypothetical protein KGL91_10680 [Xanthomonadaceae bacterium]|nr:hypothetical protein [Xanthomonadaceae bacterium]